MFNIFEKTVFILLAPIGLIIVVPLLALAWVMTPNEGE